MNSTEDSSGLWNRNSSKKFSSMGNSWANWIDDWGAEEKNINDGQPFSLPVFPLRNKNFRGKLINDLRKGGFNESPP